MVGWRPSASAKAARASGHDPLLNDPQDRPSQPGDRSAATSTGSGEQVGSNRVH